MRKDDRLDLDELMEDLQNEAKNIAAGAVSRLYGIDEDAAAALLDAPEQSGYYDIQRKIPDVLTVTREYPVKVAALRQRIAKFETWLDDKEHDPNIQKLVQRRISSDEASSVGMTEGQVIGSGSKNPVEHGRKLHAYINFIVATVNIPDYFECFANHRLDHLNSMLDLFSDAVADNEAGVAQRFVDDFVMEFKRELLVTEKTESTASLASLLELHADSVRSTVRLMSGALRHYQTFSGRHGLPILDTLVRNDMRTPDNLAYVAPGMRRLDSRGVNRKAAHQLLQALGTEEALELFDAMVAAPEIIDTYLQLHKANVSPLQYARFILDDSTMYYEPAAKKTMLDLVRETTLIAGQEQAARQLMESGTSLLSDPNFGQLLQLARSYSLAHLLLEDYVSAQASGQTNKARAVLTVGHYAPDAAELKEIRQKLRAAQDSKLDWIKETTALAELKAGLAQLRKTQAVAPIKRARADWYQAMVASLAPAGSQSSLAQQLEEVRNILGDSLDRRLKDVWLNQPAALEKFCSDVIKYRDSVLYRQMIKDYRAFNHYQERLSVGHKEFMKKLDRIETADEKDVYMALNRLLDTTAYRSPEIEEIQNAENTPIDLNSYGRIIIWGGRTPSAARTRIKACIDKPVEIFDTFNRKTDLAGISESDVVIMRTDIEHTLYYSVKKYCKRHGIKLLHFNQAGTTPMVDFLVKSTYH
ncbi:MAG: hypothetical protein HY519_03400 [Candidatus Aenigmarchaeota archaeon]|nr:hypothetical protein [Candidatus Aenigmarchaeota archaeon]